VWSVSLGALAASRRRPAGRNTWLQGPAILNDAARKRVRETTGRIARERKTPTRGRSGSWGRASGFVAVRHPSDIRNLKDVRAFLELQFN